MEKDTSTKYPSKPLPEFSYVVELGSFSLFPKIQTGVGGALLLEYWVEISPHGSKFASKLLPYLLSGCKPFSFVHLVFTYLFYKSLFSLSPSPRGLFMLKFSVYLLCIFHDTIVYSFT